MRNLTIPKNVLRQRQIRMWKKRHLSGSVVKSQAAEVTIARQPAFGANTDAADLNDFLNRFRPRN